MYRAFFLLSLFICYSTIYAINRKNTCKLKKSQQLEDILLNRIGVENTELRHFYETLYNMGILAILVIFYRKKEKIPYKSFYITVSILLLYRSIILISTDIPKIKNCKDELYKIPIFGGCYDKVFSGHISVFYTLILFIVTYTDHEQYALWYYFSIVIMSLLSLLSKSHYTIDIVLALIISYLNFYRFNDS